MNISKLKIVVNDPKQTFGYPSSSTKLIEQQRSDCNRLLEFAGTLMKLGIPDTEIMTNDWYGCPNPSIYWRGNKWEKPNKKSIELVKKQLKDLRKKK